MQPETIKIYDEETKQVEEISLKDLDERLEDLVEMLKRCLKKLQELGTYPMGYNLQSFEVSLSLKAGIFIISTEGAIKLTYKRA